VLHKLNSAVKTDSSTGSSPTQLGSSVSHLAQGIACLYRDPHTPLWVAEVSIATRPTMKSWFPQNGVSELHLTRLELAETA
jgi:hypothetical protein